MILRKPYAVFIKYFKLMHLIMTLLIAYLMYRTGFISAFFSERITSNIGTIKFDLTDELFNFYMFLIPFVLIIFNFLILSVLAFKKKPYKFYIISTLVYFFMIIMNNYFYNVLSALEVGYVDLRSLRAVRDFSTFTLIFEAVVFIKTFISATGFDIKKFDFGKDIAELKVEETDNEEFEFEIKVDTDKAKRNVRSFLRNTKYVYVENRYVINFILLILFSVSSFLIYFNVTIYNKVILENHAFSITGKSLMITNTYVTSEDYQGNLMSEDKLIVAVEINVRNNFSKSDRFEFARAKLKIGNKEYTHTNNYRDRLKDIGITYDYRALDITFNKYLLVYEVSKDDYEKNMTFMYYDNVNYVAGSVGASVIKVSLSPKELDKSVESFEYQITNNLEFKKYIENMIFTINSFEISKTFYNSYNFCATTTNCFESREYVTPTYSGNTDKALLKIAGSLDGVSNYESLKELDPFFIIKEFGYIEYKVNGISKKTKIVNEVLSDRQKTNEFYIEVPIDLLNATEINVILNIRDTNYIYNLRK